jgi:hypothetical protein
VNKFPDEAFSLLSLSLALLLCFSAVPHQTQAEEQVEALRAPFHVDENILACGRALHYYFNFMDAELGLVYLRVPT